MELLFSVLVDDNSGDHIGEIYKILGLEPRKQHDQYDLIMQLNDKLLQCGAYNTVQFRTGTAHKMYLWTYSQIRQRVFY